MMRKTILLILSCALAAQMCLSVYAQTDETIFLDPVRNTYTGRAEAGVIIGNTDFSDVQGPALESIARLGALNMVKGFGEVYRPESLVTNEEAIAFVERAMGMEEQARQAAVTLGAGTPEGSPFRELWSVGYMNIALQQKLITQEQYNESIGAVPAPDEGAGEETPDVPAPGETQVPFRQRPVTREQMADWLYRGLMIINKDIFTSDASQQYMYQFEDFAVVSLDKAQAVETMLRLGIMTGTDGLFRPQDTLTRLEMAQILRNLDTTYYTLRGYEKKFGTVGGYKDAQTSTTGSASLTRDYYIRTSEGTIDILRYEATQSGSKDCVVFKDSLTGGLDTLAEGDQVEYIVNPLTMQVLYVQVTLTPMLTQVVQGILQPLWEDGENRITITDAEGKRFSYTLADGMQGTDGTIDYIMLNGLRRDASRAPVGSRVELTLNNDIVVAINYLGEQNIVAEFRGIVLENNPELGYLEVIDNKANKVIKNFYESDIQVQKIEYYDSGSGVSYFSSVFPNFSSYDPRETSITALEPGDIVYIRVSAEDTDYIESISAATNYMMRYGKIMEFTPDQGYFNMLVQYEDSQTAWFEVPESIFMSRSGRPVNASSVQIGDWARLLINQAIITPGEVIESVKEISLEGDEHFISTIIKGQLTGLDAVQNQLMVRNSQILAKTGWSNHQNVAQYSIAGRDIEYYLDGERINLDYAVKFLKRAEGEVYIALENNYAGEKVKKVTFRSGRDELLDADMVVQADGSGSFTIVSNNGQIATDSGTIVRRYGRLVNGNDIVAPDYAVVSLNGGNKAAVVDITDAPGNVGVMVARGRVLSVDEGRSFKVQSISLLTGNTWTYSPVQREFTVDYDTIFMDASGVADSGTFIDYTDTSVANKAYNVVIDGARAARVIDAPYPNKSVRGTVYQAESGILSVNDAAYYNDQNGRWMPVSYANPTLRITSPREAIIVKNNKLVNFADLVPGDQVRVLTDALPDPIAGGAAVTGYIILVEN
ncbi:MAG: S-layer homology domain-containing protein [Clostridiales bacterium]|jgi:hypothetical protein|nr:S-layer homology domain-containing protein [Clostridiales bacterium]